MATHRSHAQTLTLMRQAWERHLSAIGGKLTEQCAEDFLPSTQDALKTLADELRAQLRLGMAEAVHVAWDDERSEWRVAVYLQDGRRKRCPLSEYFQMPDDVTEDDLRRAVVEIAFVHNVSVQPFDVEVDAIERFAGWRKGEMEALR